jgi:hypothetical protein
MLPDIEFVRAFEDGSLPVEVFDHRSHLRLAWIYLERHGRDGALERLAVGLKAFATLAGKAEKFDYPLTRAWLDALDRARQQHPAARTIDELTAARPDLLDRSSVTIGGR